MGGPRGQTIRDIASGRRCYRCERMLDTSPWCDVGERACDKCAAESPVVTQHRVYVQFFQRRGWVVNFLEPDLRRSVGRIRTFGDFEAIRGMFERCAESRVLSDRQALDYAEREGRGSFWVRLTPEQYRKLKG